MVPFLEKIVFGIALTGLVVSALGLLTTLLRDRRIEDRREKARIKHFALIDGMGALLLGRLQDFAKQLRVPVCAASAAMLRDWRTDTSPCGIAKKTPNGYVIYIREDMIGEFWVLAHELGHVVSWMSGGTSSEHEADQESEKILLSVMTAEERKVLGPIVTEVLHSKDVRDSASEQEARSRDLARRFGPRRIVG